MSRIFDLILRNGTAMTPSGRIETSIGVVNGKIAAIGALHDASAEDEIDCAGLHILPGVIDTQVHFREPGNEQKEDLETGTMSAVAGGVTAIFEMPNTDPLTTTPEALAQKVELAEKKAWCDFAFFMGGTGENAERLAELERLPGCCGVKIFMGSSTGNLLSAEDEVIERILANGTRRMAVHAEDEPRLKERKKIAEDSGDVADHPNWRDVESAVKATKRVIALAEKTGRRIHVLHVTTAEEMEILARHKQLVTCEVTPQHLTLAAPDCYERIGSRAQMNPPVREERHQSALWKAIANGVADVIGSDHAPHLLDEKARPYPQSPSGMPGVQTTVPLMLNHVHEGRLSLERMVDLLCHGPQRLYNIAGKGRLCVGYDADFTVVDLKAKREIRDDWVKSRCGWTPFDGMHVTGWPILTIIRGHIAMQDDELLTKPVTRPVRFAETFPGLKGAETQRKRAAAS